MSNNTSLAECPSVLSLGLRILCIFNYGGNLLDIIINYILILLSIVCGGIFVRNSKKDFNKTLNEYRDGGSCLFLSYLGVFSFQIGLCLILGCTGVSIVWNSVAGFFIQVSIHNGRKNKSIPPFYIILYLTISISVDIYYAMTEELLTSIAHCAALILGLTIGTVYHRRFLINNIKSKRK